MIPSRTQARTICSLVLNSSATCLVSITAGTSGYQCYRRRDVEVWIERQLDNNGG
jgi:hypothetical protein